MQMRTRLKGVISYESAGRTYSYLRRKGQPNVRIEGKPGSPQFMAAYNAAVSGELPQRQSHDIGTFGKLIADFYRSVAFRNLKPNSQRVYRLILDALSAKHGTRPARTLPRDFAVRLIEKIGDKRPAMANLTASVLSRLMTFAVKSGVRTDNPLMGMEKYKGGTRHTWTDAELTAFETRWPLGTRERLAYALLLYTGQRGGDVARMRRQDIADGAIHLVQEKTGAELHIPIHANLHAALKAGPSNGMNLIGDHAGRPMGRAGLTALMKRGATLAGLPSHCLPHGLRKAMMRRLAERGGTSKELQAISGHATLEEVERYTKAADQRKLSKAAMNKLDT
jgi:integrase